MKKLVALALSSLMVFGLVACNNTTKTAETKGSEAPASEAPASEAPASEDKGGEAAGLEGTPVAVSYYTFADTYITAVRNVLSEELKGLGLNVTDGDSQTDQAKQNEYIDTSINAGAKLLVVNLVETGSKDAAQQITDKAKAANLPLVYFNREVADEIIQSYDKSIFVGTIAKEAGILQGQMIGKYIVENFDKVDLNKDGKISYMMLKGQEQNPEAEMRTQYAVEEANKILKDAGKEELVYYIADATSKYQVDPNGAWSQQAGTDFMQTALSQYNEENNNMIELVIANNDGMALGAVSALQAKGWNNGDEAKTVPVFGVDAIDDAVKAIKEKAMTGTIKQDAEAMAKAIAGIVKNYLSGKGATEGLDLRVDENVAKVRIPYAIYTGE